MDQGKVATVPEIETSYGVRLWASDDGGGPLVVLVAGYTAPAARRGRPVVIEESGHAVNLDRVEEFDRVLPDFLGEL